MRPKSGSFMPLRKSDCELGKGIAAGNTERYERVFALWVNLQKTMRHRWSNEIREDAPLPWNCQDTRVHNAWDALTQPRNEVALEILSHQLPESTQLEIIRKALQVSRDRKDKEQSSGH